MAIGAVGAGIGIGNISSLGLRMAAFAEMGALSGLATASIMGGDLGAGAIGGAAFGAVTGLITSQQMTNLRAGNGFVSNDQYAAAQAQKLGAGTGPQRGSLGLYANKGHTYLGLADDSTGDVIVRGKWPNPLAEAGDSKFALGKALPGQIVDEHGGAVNAFRTSKLVAKVPLNDAQYAVAYGYMNGDPGTFALTTNCTEWALQGMRAIGLRAPSNLTTFSFTDPAKIMEWDGN